MAALLPLLLLAALPQQGEAGPTLREALDAGETMRVDGVLFLMNDEVITESMIGLDAERVLRMRPDILRLHPDTGRSEVFSQTLSEHLYDLIALEGFNRLGLDHALLEQQVTARIQEMIEDDGSRARFEQRLRAMGFDMTSYRSALQSDLIRLTWRSIVTGEQPSPLEGRRNQVRITPAEIREAFEKDPERWKQDKSLVWLTLQFFDNDEGTGVQRARAMAEQLRSQAVGIAQARAAANSSFQDKGDPARKNLRPDLQSFLQEAQEGGVSDVDPISGLGAQFVYLETILPAHVTGFEEAQAGISEALRRERYERIVNEAIGELNRSSYIWFPFELKAFMSSVPGLARDTVGETEF